MFIIYISLNDDDDSNDYDDNDDDNDGGDDDEVSREEGSPLEWISFQSY
jgi:hypothetical protein